ncbi:MAG: hypothetical protein LC623_04610 [Halobacteriales archaeon]|nr:hypothetical protein [Halobacteriales archaeon]
MNPEIAALRIDHAELQADLERNRRQRMEYVEFKARWLRDHAVTND